MLESAEPLCGVLSDLLDPLPQATKPPTDALQATGMRSGERGDHAEQPWDSSGGTPLGRRPWLLPGVVYCLHLDEEGTKIQGINSYGLAIKGNRIHPRDCN